jgi:hypothetical protein
MNIFFAFVQQNYVLLLLPLIAMAIAQVIAFALRRYFASILKESQPLVQEATQQSEQVIHLEIEIKRLREELEVIKTQVNGAAYQSRSVPLPSISTLAPGSA